MRSWFGILLCLVLAGCHSTPKKPVKVLTADRILIEKDAHRMTLFNEGKPLRSYQVALGRGGLEKKEREGDGRTPEGVYKITERKADSAFHLALRISYPDINDIAYAERLSVPPGGNIMIHGMKNGYSSLGFMNTWSDWTNGCIAVTDEQMNEIWAMVPVDTQVEIRR